MIFPKNATVQRYFWAHFEPPALSSWRSPSAKLAGRAVGKLENLENFEIYAHIMPCRLIDWIRSVSPHSTCSSVDYAWSGPANGRQLGHPNGLLKALCFSQLKTKQCPSSLRTVRRASNGFNLKLSNRMPSNGFECKHSNARDTLETFVVRILNNFWITFGIVFTEYYPVSTIRWAVFRPAWSPAISPSRIVQAASEQSQCSASE